MSALLKRPKPTQKEIVLKMLEEAGDRGIHSFQFMQIQLPRVAARVCELRAEGHEITSEHELLHGSATGVRYKLARGPGANHGDPVGGPDGRSRAGKAALMNRPVLNDKRSCALGSELFPQTPYEHMQDAS